MRFTIDPSSSAPMYAQLVEQVKYAIASGNLRINEALPSLREVATRLRISPLTVKKAYGELETSGIVTTEQGRGTFVSGGTGTFSAQYRHEALCHAVDRLLMEAYHLGASSDEVTALLHERREALKEAHDGT
jgi:GntR family transcriptional regulator